MNRFLYFTIVLLLTFSACKKENTAINTDICNEKRRPIVMVHGFLASGDTYAQQILRFNSADYCAERIFLFDWNTLGGNTATTLVELDSFINEVLATTQADKIDLAGHSAGSNLCYTYLTDSIRSKKVAHYAHLAGNPHSQPAGDKGQIPTLNIWSDADLIVNGDSIPKAININLLTKDHYEVATCSQTFHQMYCFFTDGQIPANLEPQPQSKIILDGKVLTLGENEPLANTEIEIYELNQDTGEPISSSSPTQKIWTDSKGNWGGFIAKPATYYMFKVIPSDPNDRTILYYREPFIRSNKAVYLRTIPPPSSLGGILLGGLPNDDAQTVLGIFTANQAVINGRDKLSQDGFDLSSVAFASAQQSTIAYFLYDDNNNQLSENTPIGLFASFPFLEGADRYLPTQPKKTIHLEFNGRKLHVPNLSSKSEGIQVAVFD